MLYRLPITCSPRDTTMNFILVHRLNNKQTVIGEIGETLSEYEYCYALTITSQLSAHEDWHQSLDDKEN